MTDADRSLSSSDAMRASSIACSFFASSYSEFSEMSPNSRASLMRSATSRRLSVERYSISFLRFSRPSGVRMTSFCMSSSLGVGSGERKRPHRADEGMRSDAGAAEHGSTEIGDDRSLLGKRLGALQRVLHRAPGAQPFDVPGVELAQVARGPFGAEMLLGAIDDPLPLGDDLGVPRLVVALAQHLREQPRVAEAPAGQHHGLAAGVFEHPADVLGVVHAAGDDHRHGQLLHELSG